MNDLDITPSTVVISAPSGAGKTTLNRRLQAEHPNVEVSISHTTRAPREGEQDGVHYYFVSQKQFDEHIIKEDFLEWAEVHGHFYGTSKKELQRITQKGHIPLLEIDTQGWLLTRPKIPRALSIFILPPSLKTLWDRLQGRGTDQFETCWLRLQNAYREIEIANHYDYFIVNDDLDQAFLELKSIVIDKKPGKIDERSGRELCDQLKFEFHHADWIQGIRAQIHRTSSE